MSNPQEEKQPSKTKWTRETWEAAMRDIQENQRLSRNPLTAKEMKAMRYTLNQDWEKAQQIEKLAPRYGEMLEILYKRVHFLTHHLLVWEEQWEMDRRWKEEIEKQLNSFMEQATQILAAISEQAQEIINGNPKSQGEMMGLITGTLNELRDRVDGLENTVSLSRASEKVRKS